MTILIPIVSEFKDKGFKNAEKSTNALGKSLKSLGVTLGAALSVRKVTQFTKASIKAFVEEDKAVRILANNLQNLGLAYDIAPIEKYIREMQYATGVADNELRPAFQKLTTATRNIATSQELLGLALDISASTGKSLSSVVDGLSRAYLGNNTSLSRLNLGISKADLKTKNFNQITKELSTRFAGSAAKAADTYAGKMAILSAAASDAQEIIGKKLVQSLEILAGKEKDITPIANLFEKLATDVGDAVVGLATLIEKFKTLGGLLPGNKGLSLQGLNPNIPGLQAFKFLLGQGRKESASEEAKRAAIARAVAKEQGMLASRNFKIQKATTTELDKQTKLKKEANKLDKAGQMFDLERIQIEAAMQNDLTENERLRLRLMKAIINENVEQATQLASKLAKSQEELAKLSLSANQFKPYNPFEEWEDAIIRMQRLLGQTTAPAAIGGGSTVVGGASGNETVVSGNNPTVVLGGGTGLGGGLAFPESTVNPDNWWDDPGYIAAQQMLNEQRQQNVNLTINVSGTGDLSDDTKKKIIDTVVDYSAIGYSTSGWYQTTGNIAI